MLLVFTDHSSLDKDHTVCQFSNGDPQGLFEKDLFLPPEIYIGAQTLALILV